MKFTARCGPFKKKGRMFVWITHDEEKMPVQLKAKINIGTITAALSKVSKAPALRHESPAPQAGVQSVPWQSRQKQGIVRNASGHAFDTPSRATLRTAP